MKYLSVCSGIEAATVAWHHMGWEPVGFSENEKFPSAVLAHHYPDVTNYGDMTNYEQWTIRPFQLLAGGTPCQSFSIAGLRKGLHDPRGGLMLTFLEIARDYKPEWIVWENVPGVLSSHGGRDFGTFLGALAELGYGWAYRVLDAQNWGVPQRRRRVFVVGCLGDGAAAAKVLFEREGLQWDTPQSREKRQTAPTIPARSSAGGGLGTDFDCDGGLICMAHGKGGAEIRTNGSPALTCNHEAQILVHGAPIYTLTKRHSHAVAHVFKVRGGCEGGGKGYLGQDDMAFTLATGHDQDVFIPPMLVRRLTPTECERLQGFPDGYTDIRPKGKPTPDGPRYKALGNSMAVPVMRWIGDRISRLAQ